MRCALLGQCWQPHLPILRMAGTKELNFLISIPQFVQFPNLFLYSCLSSYISQDKSLLACLETKQQPKKTPQFLLIHNMLVLKCLVVSNSFGTPWINIYTLVTVTVTQSYPTLSAPKDCSPAGSSVRGISQARILEQVAISYSRGSSWPRNQTPVSWVSCTGSWILYLWAVLPINTVLVE